MKKLWRNNKIVIILFIILLICVGTIAYVALTYFFGGSDTVYGERLDNIEDKLISDSEIDTYIENILEEEKIDSASISVNGKIIYIKTEFIEEVSMSSAKKLASNVLTKFEEDTFDTFDCNITISGVDFILMGYKNNTSAAIVWNNNTAFELEESE